MLTLLKKDLIFRSVGIPLQPADCIIIGDILVENMPWEKLLAQRVQCSHRNFESKLCFFGVTKSFFFYITPLVGYSLTIIRNSPFASKYRLLDCPGKPNSSLLVPFNCSTLIPFHPDWCCPAKNGKPDAWRQPRHMSKKQHNLCLRDWEEYRGECEDMKAAGTGEPLTWCSSLYLLISPIH